MVNIVGKSFSIAGAAMLLKVNGAVEVEVTEELKKKILDHPMLENSLPMLSAHDFLEQKFGSDEEGRSYKEPFMEQLITFVRESLDDEVTLNLIHPGCALQVNLQSDGLNELASYLHSFLL
jgi:hypothetical protein